jgi:poly(3-hydroxybutyrate) depolymerase
VLRQYLAAHADGEAGLQRQAERRHEGGRHVTRTRWHGADGRTAAEHWQLHGAGHAWAGGSAAGSHTDTQGPSASEEMLRFFLAVGQPG